MCGRFGVPDMKLRRRSLGCSRYPRRQGYQGRQKRIEPAQESERDVYSRDGEVEPSKP